MARILIYFIGWVVVPWAASAFWLTMVRMKSEPKYGFISAVSDAVFAGAFGWMFSLVLTVPLSMILFLLLQLLPGLTRMRAMRVFISFLLITIGGVWAVWLVKEGGFAALHTAAFVVGGVSGWGLAVFSYHTLGRGAHTSGRR